MLMPFGKYRGTPIGEVPTSYLSWLLRSIKLRDPQLEFEVQLEWLSRCAQHEHTYSEQTASRHGIQLGTDDVPLVRRVFDAGFKSIARKLHPDLGGSTAEMQQLNRLAESVRTQLDALERAS